MRLGKLIDGEEIYAMQYCKILFPKGKTMKRKDGRICTTFPSIISVLMIFFSVCAVGAQAPIDELLVNRLDSFRTKIELLEMPLDGYPYLAMYLRQAPQVKLETVDYLITKGADLEMPDEDAVYPIHAAVARGELAIVKKLTEAGVNLSKTISLNSISDMSLSHGERRISFYPGTLVDPVMLSVIMQKPDIVAYFFDRINLSSEIKISSHSYPDYPTLFTFELPLWTREGNPTADSLVIAKMLISKYSESTTADTIERLSSYDPLLVAILLDNIPMLKKGLIATRKESYPYIVYALLTGATQTLDFLMRYNQLQYSDAIPTVSMDLKYGTIDDFRYYKSDPITPIPLYAYPMLAGNVDMVLFLKSKGVDFSQKFSVYVTEPLKDITYSMVISGHDSGKRIQFDEEMNNALR